MVLILPDAGLKSCYVLAHCFKWGLYVVQSVKDLGKDVDKTKVSTSWVAGTQCRVLWAGPLCSLRLLVKNQTIPATCSIKNCEVFSPVSRFNTPKLFEADDFNSPHCLGFCSMQIKGAALSFH